MRINAMKLCDISFHYVAYSASLKESLLRAGQNFPIYVKRCEQGFLCSDGHKRCSAIQDIQKEYPQLTKLQQIHVIIEDGARTSPPYSLHNHH